MRNGESGVAPQLESEHGDDEPRELPKRQFEVVLSDPPWSYYGQQDKWAAAAKFYPLMSDEEIASLDIRSLMTKRSLLFCWATCPRLDSAIHLIERWGLFYRGVAFVWIKTKRDGTPIGAQGVRPSVIKPLTELVLVASPQRTGRPLPLADESVCQTIFAPVGAHSEKPEEVQARIERLYPDASKLELFARRKRPGWSSWGNEVTSDISLA